MEQRADADDSAEQYAMHILVANKDDAGGHTDQGCQPHQIPGAGKFPHHLIQAAHPETDRIGEQHPGQVFQHGAPMVVNHLVIKLEAKHRGDQIACHHQQQVQHHQQNSAGDTPDQLGRPLEFRMIFHLDFRSILFDSRLRFAEQIYP